MPVARYVFYVGAVLLALLFVADAWLPRLPVAREERGHATAIRIHSDRKWPERIILDTSLRSTLPAERPGIVAAIPLNVDAADNGTREAFAQLQPNAAPERLRRPEKLEWKSRGQNRVARRHSSGRMRLVARPLRYGWLGDQIW